MWVYLGPAFFICLLATFCPALFPIALIAIVLSSFGVMK